MSFTSYAYINIKLDKQKNKRGQWVIAIATFTNKGKVSGEEVVQLYITDLKTSVEIPLYALICIKRVELNPGELKEVLFEVTPKMMELINESGAKVIEPGDFNVYISGSTPSEVLTKLGATKPVSKIFNVK